MDADVLQRAAMDRLKRLSLAVALVLPLSGCMAVTAVTAVGSAAVTVGGVAVSAVTTAGSAVASGASAVAHAVTPKQDEPKQRSDVDVSPPAASPPPARAEDHSAPAAITAPNQQRS